MKECPHCGYQNPEEETICLKCKRLLAAQGDDGASDPGTPSASDSSCYTVPFSISVSDAHSILFSWLEKFDNESYERDDFHIVRLHKKYYGCWLYWFLIPQSPGIDEGSEMEMRKKIILVPGSDVIPQEVLELSSQYDFMQLCLLDDKILNSPEYIPATLSEKEAYLEAISRMKHEEPALFDEMGNLLNNVQLTHSIRIALPVWKGAYNYRGGEECAFFINAQKGHIVGAKFSRERTPIPPAIVPYVIGAAIAVLILLSIIYMCDRNEPGGPSGSSTGRRVATSDITGGTASPAPTPSRIQTIAPTLSTSSAPSIKSPEPTDTAVYGNSDHQRALKTVLDNFRAIDEKEFEQVHALRTSRVKSQKSISDYEGMYANNSSINVLDAKVDSLDGDEAHVTVLITSVDTSQGKKMRANYEGWFLLRKENGLWLIEDSNLKEVPDTMEELKP